MLHGIVWLSKHYKVMNQINKKNGLDFIRVFLFERRRGQALIYNVPLMMQTKIKKKRHFFGNK
jgi:hypothetical protein